MRSDGRVLWSDGPAAHGPGLTLVRGKDTTMPKASADGTYKMTDPATGKVSYFVAQKGAVLPPGAEMDGAEPDEPKDENAPKPPRYTRRGPSETTEAAAKPDETS